MQQIKGYLLILASVISFALMSALVKMIPQVDSTVTTFTRFAVGVGILGILAMTGRIKLNFVNSPLLLLRGFTGGLAVFMLYYSIVHLGVGKATVIVYSYPVFATLFSVLFFKEKVRLVQWVFVLMAFGGIFLLSVKSGMKFSEVSKYELIALASSLLSAVSVVLVKKLHNTDSSYAIFFAQSIIGFWLFLFPSTAASQQSDMSIAVILIALGVVSAIGQLVMTEGYKYVPVSRGSSMHMMVPVLNIILGYLFFDEVLSVRELSGAALVVLACVGVISTKSIRFKFFKPW
ncbi:DMT family transporter [Labilibacter marinus]|uniref:DMT family transporter n=1 Tax=Labilibacter marinus TaxID=1477105 RepID=UPI00082C740B|nr:DMT family transporter [Labilibacter marinus]